MFFLDDLEQLVIVIKGALDSGSRSTFFPKAPKLLRTCPIYIHTYIYTYTQESRFS